jgi:chromosomal replication initiator protein
MLDNPSDLWARCLQSIKRKIQPQSFQTWFGPTSSKHICAEKAVIEVPTSFFADWLEEHYSWLIQSTLEEETTWKPFLVFVVREEPGQAQGPVDFSLADPTEPLVPPAPQRDVPGEVKPVFPLNPRYRFEQFVVGGSNEFTFTAARSVAESPGQTAFNPLFIYGGVGLGKTHLLQAVGDFCVRNRTAERVVYVTAEQFISDYIASMRQNDHSEFVKTYRKADVLLIDDIQFYVQTEGCQREFIHTFNALSQNDKQVVISSDRPPATLKGFEDRLISRLQWGLVTDIEVPDLETRIAILNQKAEERGIDLSHDVARFLAVQIDSNIRELEGALTRLVAFAAHKHQTVSIDLARQALLRRSTRATPSIGIEEIQKATADFFHIPIETLIGSTRKQEITTARHAGMYLCKSLTGAPLKAIGSHFGNRDHTTVIYACRNVEQKLNKDPGFGDMIAQLRDHIQGRLVA